MTTVEIDGEKIEAEVLSEAINELVAQNTPPLPLHGQDEAKDVSETPVKGPEFRWRFDFQRVKPKERRKLMRDVLTSQTRDDGDDYLLPWMDRLLVDGWPEGKNYTIKEVYEAATGIEVNEVCRAFYAQFRQAFK